MKMDTLLNFSGGLDSTYCLYKYLKDNPQKTLLVHHCHLVTKQGRANLETKAVANILKWCKDNGLSNFEYRQTTFNYGSLNRVLDVQVIYFLTGIIMRQPQYKSSIRYYISCLPKDELQRLGEETLQGIWDRANTILSATAPEADLETVYMMKDKTKAQIVAEMPKSLTRLAWSCRQPKNNQPCGKCHTCKQLEGVAWR